MKDQEWKKGENVIYRDKQTRQRPRASDVQNLIDTFSKLDQLHFAVRLLAWVSTRVGVQTANEYLLCKNDASCNQQAKKKGDDDD